MTTLHGRAVGSTKRLGGELDAAYRPTIDAMYLAIIHVHQLAAARLAIEQLDALPEPRCQLAMRELIN
jgi:hypothetical protein